MKKILGCFALFCSVVVACDRVDENNNDRILNSVVFSAGFEDVSTKVYVDSDFRLHWHADDRLTIFTSTYNQQYRFTGDTGMEYGEFEEVEGGGFHSSSPINTNYAVYPYSSDNKISASGDLTVKIPMTQQYAERGFGPGANTMVAVTSGKNDYSLCFKNLCGYLVLRLYGSDKIKSITLKGNKGERISGQAAVSALYGHSPEMTMSESAGNSITLECVTSVQIGGTMEDATEFWFCVPPVTFTGGFTVTMVNESGAEFEKTVTKSCTISRNVVNRMAPLLTDFPSIFVPEAIDLGLSVKWAACNLGARVQEGIGDYYAWGEMVPYYVEGQGNMNPPQWGYHYESGYSSASYRFINGTKLNMYNNDGEKGSVDNKIVLQHEHDVAMNLLGEEWRIPTPEQWQELIDNCYWSWKTVNGVTGLMLRGKKSGYNSTYLFIPVTGVREGKNLKNSTSGYYWTSALYTTDPMYAQTMYIDDIDKALSHSMRYFGLAIRPVKVVPVTSVSLSDSSIELFGGEVYELSADVSPSNASNKSIRWSSSNTAVATVNSKGTVRALGKGSATITATSDDGYYTATCRINVKNVVDLGLSVKWYTSNVGAVSCHEPGMFVSWGSTTESDVYDWKHYPLCTDGYYTKLTKYCQLSQYGKVDDKTVLESVDDVATLYFSQKYGQSARTPTNKEWEELLASCTMTIVYVEGVPCARFTSNIVGYKDKYIIVPLYSNKFDSDGGNSGTVGRYWTSTVYVTPSSAYSVYLQAQNNKVKSASRDYGMMVRAVVK